MKHLDTPFSHKNKVAFFRTGKVTVLLPILLLFLFPARTFAQDTTWFKDVSAQLGFSDVHAGAIIGVDVNNDDYPDLITLFGGGTDNGFRLYLNQQKSGSTNPHDRVFVDSTAHSGLNIHGMIKDLAAVADFNNDGNVDIVINAWYFNQNADCSNNPDNGSRLHILLGDGHGHFTLKQNSGLEDLGYMSGTGVPALDYDRDGNLDLYVCTHLQSWCTGVPEPNYLMKGNGDGTFTNVSVASGVSSPARALFGANMADWNNDCYPDILTAPYESTGYGNLFQNNGNGTFTDVGIAKGYNPHWMTGDHSGHWNPNMVPWAAMPCDYNNDGNIDFLVLEVHGAPGASDGRTSIFTNQGAANGYTLVPDVSQIVRKDPQNADFGDHNGFWSDFNNDGLVDLVVGDAAYDLSSYGYPDAQRMYFCLQNSAHKFNDITQELGFIHGTTAADISNRIRRPSVMIPMDYDMDGDDDIFKAPYNADDSLNFLVLRNDIANKSHYIEIKLLAPSGVNKSCIGARVTVKSGGVKQMREIYAGQGSWTNEYPFTLNFGLANNTLVDSIDVRWPDASCSHTIITHVAADQFIKINKQGISAVPEIKTLKDGFNLYPNPAENSLTIDHGQLVVDEIEIVDLLGRRVLNQAIKDYSQQTTLDVSNLSPGVYIVTISNKEGTAVKKFVKE